jgi:tripartite-type tricarboxylate transporter receptor subunit TctC
MLTRRHLGSRTATLTLTAAGLTLARPALAAFPDRPITVIVPFAPGGANDLAGRLLADRIGPLLTAEGRALVENRPGGGSAIGADYVRRARPDGYTLLVGSASTLAVAPASGASAARYHPTRDFTPITVVGQVRDGALRLLAVTTRQRDPNFPDVPTVAEAVLPDYELTTWTVMVGPKDMPDDIAEALSKAANAALAEPRVRERLESTGTTPVPDSTPASTRAFLDREFALYQNIVQRIGLKLD